MKRSRQLAPFLLFLFLQPQGQIALRAQVDRTGITGTVTDQQGNRVPQSSVRATETGTGFQRETSTTSQGTYELSGLPPGVYSVQFLKTDRKSTRLNSSHLGISYAVFCLKKKKINTQE